METQDSHKQRIVVAGLVFLGLVIVAFFGMRTARAFREIRDHRPPPPFATKHVETDVELIRDWMTIPFISKMYRVRPHFLFEALAIPESGNKEKSLKQLNEEYYPQEAGIVLEKVKVAVSEALVNQPGSPNTPAAP
jgi:hypothetical protein